MIGRGQGTLNYRECAGTTRPYSWVCKQKSLMVNKYDKDWFLSDMYYTNKARTGPRSAARFCKILKLCNNFIVMNY